MGFSKRTRELITLPFDALPVIQTYGAAAWKEADYIDFNPSHFLKYWEGIYIADRGFIYTDPKFKCLMGVVGTQNAFTGKEVLDVHFCYVRPLYRNTRALYNLLYAVFELNSPAEWYFTTENPMFIRLLKNKFDFDSHHTQLKGTV